MTTHTVELAGITGHLIEVNVHVGGRPPAAVLVGLPDSRVRETPGPRSRRDCLSRQVNVLIF